MPLGTLGSNPQGRGQCQVAAVPPHTHRQPEGTSCWPHSPPSRQGAGLGGADSHALLRSSLGISAGNKVFLSSDPALSPHIIPRFRITCEEGLTPEHSARPSMTLPQACTAHSGPCSRLALGRLSPWPQFFKPSRHPSPAARASLCSKGQVFGEDAQRALARSLRPRECSRALRPVELQPAWPLSCRRATAVSEQVWFSRGTKSARLLHPLPRPLTSPPVKHLERRPGAEAALVSGHGVTRRAPALVTQHSTVHALACWETRGPGLPCARKSGITKAHGGKGRGDTGAQAGKRPEARRVRGWWQEEDRTRSSGGRQGFPASAAALLPRDAESHLPTLERPGAWLTTSTLGGGDTPGRGLQGACWLEWPPGQGSSTEGKTRPPPAQLQDTRPLTSLTSRGGAGPRAAEALAPHLLRAHAGPFGRRCAQRRPAPTPPVASLSTGSAARGQPRSGNVNLPQPQASPAAQQL